MNTFDLREKLKQIKISPKKSLGQNFLINERVIDQIITSVRECAPNHIIEVGPGLGALTEQLSQVASHVTLIELDNKLAEYWREKGYNLIHGDALRINWEELGQKGFSLLVSNLPYQISSSLVVHLSTISKKPVEVMILMFQKEVAQRITAVPGTKDYGLLSVIAQSFWAIEKLIDVGPTCFYPAPKVASRVLKFTYLDVSIEDPIQFLNFVKACFAQRRKVLYKKLSSYVKGQAKVSVNLEEWYTDCGLGLKVRAEDVSPKQYLQLFEAMRKWE